jgi:tetratricopeptide (TPR) repeat protein
MLTLFAPKDTLFPRVLADENPTLENLRNQSNDLQNRGKYTESIDVIQRIMQCYPDSQEAKFGRERIAYMYYQSRQYEKAVKMYQEVMEDPSTELSRIRSLNRILDILMDKQRDSKRAIEQCQEFITRYSNDKGIQDAYMSLAKCYTFAKEYEKAIEVYHRIFERFHENVNGIKIYMNIADVYKYQKNYTKAIESYRYIVEKYPNTPESASALLWMGHLYEATEQYGKAIESYNSVIQTSGDGRLIEDARNSISAVETMTKTPEEVIKKCIEQLKEPLPQKEWTRKMTKLASLYLEKQDRENGIRTLKEVVDKYPASEETAMAYVILITTHQEKMKDSQKAIEECDQVIRNYPKQSSMIYFALFMKSRIYTELKEFDKAIDIYRKIIDEYPETENAKAAKVYIRLINEYYRRNKSLSSEELGKIFKEEGIVGKPPPLSALAPDVSSQ